MLFHTVFVKIVELCYLHNAGKCAAIYQRGRRMCCEVLLLLLQLQQHIKEEEQLEQLSSHYPGPGPDYYYHRDYVHHDPGHIDKDLETR